MDRPRNLIGWRTLAAAWGTAVVFSLAAGFLDFLRVLFFGGIRWPSAARLGLRSAGLILPLVGVSALAGLSLFRLLSKSQQKLFIPRFEFATLVGSGIIPVALVVLFEKSFNIYEAAVKAGLMGIVAAVVIAGLWPRRTGPRPPKERPVASWLVFALAGTIGIIALSSLTASLPWPPPSPLRAASAKQSAGPNIVLIIMDSARADRFSVYGYGRKTSPFLERFAAESTVFDNAIAESPWTLPSHATLFTGLYPGQHNAHAEHFWLDDNYRTLAEILADSGYQTVLFSNNDYVARDTNLVQGFQRFWYKGRWDDDPRYSAPSLGKAVDTFLRSCREEWNSRVRLKFAKNPAALLDYPSAAFTNRAVGEWLDKARKAKSPFFLCINYMDVHFPYNPGEAKARLFLDEDEFGRSFALRLRRPPIDISLDVAKGQYTPDELRIINALYDGDVRSMDGDLEALCAKLKTLGVYDQTVTIITSDHGEYLGTHNRFAHGLGLNEEVLHVPLLARYPGVFAGGARAGGVVRLADIFDTLLTLAKIEERPKTMEGTRELFGLPKEDGRTVFSEFRFPVHVLATAMLRDDNAKLLVEQKAVRDRNFKLIWKSRGLPEFYDLAADPQELKNLFSEENEKARMMFRELVGWMSRDVPQEKSGQDLLSPIENRRLLERMRTLGYVK